MLNYREAKKIKKSLNRLEKTKKKLQKQRNILEPNQNSKGIDVSKVK